MPGDLDGQSGSGIIEHDQIDSRGGQYSAQGAQQGADGFIATLCNIGLKPHGNIDIAVRPGTPQRRGTEQDRQLDAWNKGKLLGNEGRIRHWALHVH